MKSRRSIITTVDSTLGVSPSSITFPLFFRLKAVTLSVVIGSWACWAHHASAQNPEPPLPNPADPVATMGICYHYVEGAAPTDAEVEAIAAAGFTWIRTDLNWNNIENPGQQGDYYWGYFDSIYQAFTSRGIRIMFILDYVNQNYDNALSVYDDTGRAAYARFAAAAALHYNSLGGGVVFEIYNEPENYWYLNSDQKQESYPDQQALIDSLYAQMALPAAQAIKQALPSAHVVGPAAVQWDTGLIEATAAASSTGGAFQFMNGASFHQYGESPEDYTGNFAQANTFYASLAQYNPSLSSFITEQGYGTAYGFGAQLTSVQQAQYAARTFLYGVYAHLGLNIYYCWHEAGVSSHGSGQTYLSNSDNDFGLVDNVIVNGNPSTVTMTPKPAYYACKTYAQQLSGFLYQNRVSTGDADVFCLAFDKGSVPCYVLWSASGDSDSILLTLANGAYTLTNYDGTVSTQTTVTNGSLSLTIDGGPQYLVMNSAPATLPPLPSITLPSGTAGPTPNAGGVPPSSVSSGTLFHEMQSPNKFFSLSMQADGNLVEYNGNQPIWSSNTSQVGTNPYEVVMQADGNLVLYQSNGSPIWYTSTYGQGVAPYHLDLQNNGVIGIYDSQGNSLFATGSVSNPIQTAASLIPPSVNSGSTFPQLASPNGQYELIIQADGNLVEYNGNLPVWMSNTANKGSGPYTATVQADGNFVVYDTNRTPIWYTGTYGQGVAPYQLAIDDSGNIQLQDSQNTVLFSTGSVENPIFSNGYTVPSSVNSGTSFSEIVSPHGRYELLMQSDGSLVEYDGGTPVWNSNPTGVVGGPYRAVMQDDGNLVVYQGNGGPIWDTGTWNQGVGPYTLDVQDDGNVVIYDSTNTFIFKTRDQ